jgi:hypothetical protein
MIRCYLGAHQLFLISNEPSDLKSEEHQIWESLLNEDQISLINSEECGKIATLIEERNAGRFLWGWVVSACLNILG